MQSTFNRIAIALAAALLSTAALAGEGDERAVTATPAAAKSRAQVLAEQARLPPVSAGDRYPLVRETAGTRTRAEVRAEAARTNAATNPGA